MSEKSAAAGRHGRSDRGTSQRRNSRDTHLDELVIRSASAELSRLRNGIMIRELKSDNSHRHPDFREG